MRRLVLIPILFLTMSFTSADLSPIFRKVATEYNVSYELMSKIADIESSFNPDAKAGTSSASGLFQIIRSTERWLREICDIEGDVFDPLTNSRLGGCLIQYNTKYLTRKLGRVPTFTENYTAHFLGSWTAVKFIQMVESKGSDIASERFPRESKANPRVFYKSDGTARTLAEVLGYFSDKMEKARILEEK